MSDEAVPVLLSAHGLRNLTDKLLIRGLAAGTRERGREELRNLVTPV